MQIPPQTVKTPMPANSEEKSALNNGDRQTEIARCSSGDANPDHKQKAESDLNNDSNLRQPKPRAVKRGDTLLKIASEFTPNSPEHGLRKILRLNQGSTDLDLIYPGQVIVLSTSDTLITTRYSQPKEASVIPNTASARPCRA